MNDSTENSRIEKAVRGEVALDSSPPASQQPLSHSPPGIDADALFNAAPWPAWILDAETLAFLAVNRAALAQYGYSAEEFADMTIQEACLPEDFPRLLEQFSNLPVPFAWRSVLRHCRKDGTVLWVEAACHKVEYRGRRAVFSILHDVTERVQAEEAYKAGEEHSRILLARREQEAAARQFLTEASAALASSLDHKKTLQQVADLAVPHIADWCGVDMLEADGSIEQVAVAHVDPDKLKWAHEIRKDYPPDPNGPNGLPRVLRTGKSEMNPELSQEILARNAKDERHREMIRRIDPRSIMIVPIIARERILGAITFIATHESGHRYAAEDLALAEGLAARAALAIDNARLYRAAQEEIEERKRIQEALRTSEERFRFALANSDIAVYMQDSALRYTWVYSGSLRGELTPLYGKTDAEILLTEDAARIMEIKQRVLQTGAEERHVVRATYPGQEPGFYDTLFAPLRDAAGNIAGVTGTVNNITERKKAQDVLAQHQAEIEALNVRLQRAMRETHHRVKNNLQVISALINMQEIQYSEAVPLTELRRITQHITALAAIHDLLTHQAQSDPDVSTISTSKIMQKLLPALQGLASARSIRMDWEDLHVPIRQATTLAVLVNELISNSLKHGTGLVNCRFRVTGDLAQLDVTDEGRGFPDGFDPVRSANTGMELIQSFASWDLRGSVRFENRKEGGAWVRVEFPVPDLMRTVGES